MAMTCCELGGVNLTWRRQKRKDVATDGVWLAACRRRKWGRREVWLWLAEEVWSIITSLCERGILRTFSICALLSLSSDVTNVLETLHLSYDGARHPANNKAMMCGWFLNNPDDGFNLINTLSVWAARHELNIYEFVNAFIILLQCYWQFVWICGQSWTKLSQDGTTTCPEQRVGTVRLSYTW